MKSKLCFKINFTSPFVRIRKVQNYDWADEYVKKGNDMIEIKNFEKAIEYFNDAEKLDSLNKEIYHQKGFCYIQLVFVFIYSK
jgi:hypothetical protein